MFHFTTKRIEAQVTICFVAFKVYKLLERILKPKNINLSINKVLDIAKTITTIKVWLPKNIQVLKKTMLITAKHKSIEPVLNDDLF